MSSSRRAPRAAGMTPRRRQLVGHGLELAGAGLRALQQRVQLFALGFVQRRQQGLVEGRGLGQRAAVHGLAGGGGHAGFAAGPA